jgi:hypothetical protein
MTDEAPMEAVRRGVKRDGVVESRHAQSHKGPGTARLLVMSTMRFPDVVEHPEDDRVLIMHGPPAEGTEFLLFKRSDGSDVLPSDG